MATNNKQHDLRYRELGKALSRPVSGLAQWQLAAVKHVSQGTVSRWIAGKSRPRPEQLGKLAAFLNRNPRTLAELAGYYDDFKAYRIVLEAYAMWDLIIAHPRNVVEESLKNAPPPQMAVLDEPRPSVDTTPTYKYTEIFDNAQEAL